MESQLRSRIENLVSISKHPIRGIEHKTFRRLLYRNRNQHRHGFYFRKLDHVRRLLSQIDRHVAWESLQYSLGDTDDKREHIKASCPLSISSLTVDDLKSVEILFEKLVHTVIIGAARKVVTDLVSREHFLPFAVSVLATLARLFVVERKILSEVRGISTEMSVLFATDGSSRPLKGHLKDTSALPNDEDIGLEVSAPREMQPTPQREAQAVEVASDPKHVCREGRPAARETELPEREGTRSSGPAESKAQEPSLYHLVAKHVDTSKFSVELRARTSVSLPEAFGMYQGLERTSKSIEGPEVRVAGATTPDVNTIAGSHEVTQEHPGVSKLDENTRQQSSGQGGSSKFGMKASEDASDSDDIDDIFDGLEDS